MTKNDKETKVKETKVKETCVLCGCETNVNVDTHIDLRDYYVEGCGQLCRKCYLETYSE